MSHDKQPMHRREREVILEVLQAQDRGTADQRALWFALSNLGHPMTKGTFDEHLTYLEGKRYLIAQDRHLGDKVAVRILTITPAGVDLLDGSICDPGVGPGCPRDFLPAGG